MRTALEEELGPCITFVREGIDRGERPTQILTELFAQPMAAVLRLDATDFRLVFVVWKAMNVPLSTAKHLLAWDRGSGGALTDQAIDRVLTELRVATGVLGEPLSSGPFPSFASQKHVTALTRRVRGDGSCGPTEPRPSPSDARLETAEDRRPAQGRGAIAVIGPSRSTMVSIAL